MSNPDRILRLLAEGPSTSGEIACALRIRRKACSATLQQMHAAGRLVRTDIPLHVTHDETTAYIYALPEHRCALAHSAPSAQLENAA